MIPLRLGITGFLSYNEPVELDFTRFSLACISGPNGAGKSSLLDAITWVLFGQARKRDESLINLQSPAAEVELTFRYEGADYRVQRTLARGKGTTLELQVRSSTLGRESSTAAITEGDEVDAWKPLTERTVRDTQARLQDILRLDYDTFVNASFFLQGKADQFAQQSPARRKEVLSSILGLGVWDIYKSRTGDRRRSLEVQLTGVEGHLEEIGAELAEEVPRREHLEGLESELRRVKAARASQAAALDNLRKTRTALEKQRLVIEGIEASLSHSQQQLSSLDLKLRDRRASRGESADLVGRGDQVERAFADWQASVRSLANWDGVAQAFRDREKNRGPLITAIASEKARLMEEHRQLLSLQAEATARAASLLDLEPAFETEKQLLTDAESQLERRARVQADLAAAREHSASLKAENEALKLEMDELAARIGALESASGAACPLCGQPLSEAHRISTLATLRIDGKQRGDRFRQNKLIWDERHAESLRLETELRELAGADAEKSARSRSVTQLAERIASLKSVTAQWESLGHPRLLLVDQMLEHDDYASEPRALLARLDADLAELGYDAAAHDKARLEEEVRRPSDDEHRRLEAARAALVPLDKEIADLEAQITERAGEIERQASQLAGLQLSFAEAARDLPDLAVAEQLLFDVQEQENHLNQEVGAARQRVSVLDDLRLRRAEFEATRQALALVIGRHKMLERGFGQDGVPALLIEQALPEVESRANEILDRLSDGQMSVRFMTQSEYKDKKRRDLRETLEIQIRDGAGRRDYEMYSGGEAFRVNFAVRLALSQVLAARKGARTPNAGDRRGFWLAGYPRPPTPDRGNQPGQRGFREDPGDHTPR